MRWMTRMLKRSPMVIIAGLGGLGKTALALEVLHNNFKAQLPQIIHVRPRATGEGLLGQLWRAFSKVLSVQIQESVLRSDPDFALATLIDMADEGPWWVVLEDLHRLGDPQQEQTLLKIAQYARSSRWIVTTRVAPGAALNQHVLRLEHLRPTALEAIAKSWAPGLQAAERQSALKASAGSPWRLYQALSGDSLEDPTLLEGVTEPQRQLLQALWVLESAVPVPLLLDACPGAKDSDWQALERRGLVVGSRQSCRLHDLTREVLQHSTVSQERHGALCEALLASPSPELKLEGLKLGSRLGRSVRELLGEPDTPVEDNGMVGQLIDAGLGLELDAILEGDGAEGLATARLLVALRTGAFQSLEGASAPGADSSVSARLLWARGLFVRNLFAQALESVRGLLGEVQSEELSLFEASCLAAQGEMVQAEACLRGFVAADDGLEWDRQELLATVLAGTGRHQGALALADGLRLRLSQTHGAALAMRGLKLVRAYYLLNRLEQAQQVLDWVVAQVGERAMALYAGRGVLEYGAILALGLGRFDQVRDIQARLAPFDRSDHAVLRSALRLAQVQLDTGQWDGLRGHLLDLVARADALCYGDAFYSATDKLMQLDMLEGLPWEALETLGLSAEIPQFEHQRRIRDLRWQVLEGYPWGEVADGLLEGVGDYTQQRCFVQMTRAMALGMGGEPERARQCALEVLEELRQTGHRVSLVECLMQACDLFWILSEHELHARLTREFGSMSRLMPSARFEAAVGWHRELLQAPRIRPEIMESLGAGRDPVAGRRARALLGDGAPLHAWDRRVLDRVLGLEGVWRPVQTRSWTEQGPVWGVDFQRQGVWDHTGCWHDLRQRAGLLGLIWHLVVQGGEASKEALVCGVWGEDEYHPLKHDNRLRLTVRRFRALIPSGDPLQAMGDGYALCGRTRLCGDA